MFKITHEYVCDICGKITSIPYAFDNDRVNLPKPIFPVGWHELSDGYVCSDHKIDIDLNLEQLVIDYLSDLAQQ